MERSPAGLPVSEQFLNYVVNDLAIASDERAARQLVVEVEMNTPLFDQVQQVTCEIPCVHLTGVKGHRAGEVCGPDDDYAAMLDLLARLRESAVTALVRGKIYDDGAGPHPADHLSGYEHGRTLTRNKGRCNDDVRGRDALSHHLLLLPVELLGLRSGVAALFLGVLGFKVQLNK